MRRKGAQWRYQILKTRTVAPAAATATVTAGQRVSQLPRSLASLRQRRHQLLWTSEPQSEEREFPIEPLPEDLSLNISPKKLTQFPLYTHNHIARPMKYQYQYAVVDCI